MQAYPDSPVLLVTFNRPANTRKVFEKIREARVKKLYVFNDGPRENNINDQEARKEIENLLTEIDWPCELHTFFPARNAGCAVGVSSAISWAFENEDALVILEDDCVPSMPFFRYCNEMLQRYKDDKKVWMISGNNYNEKLKMHDSYTFSNAALHIWGWATWKRCWMHYDITLDNWPDFKKLDGFASIFTRRKEIDFWTNRYDRLYQRREVVARSTWDYQFVLSAFINRGLCIVPAENLVINIGYEGTHTQGKNRQHSREASESFEITNHPPLISANKEYDTYHMKNHWMKKKPALARIMKKITKMLNH